SSRPNLKGTQGVTQYSRPKKKPGARSPRRWGWGIPLGKRPDAQREMVYQRGPNFVKNFFNKNVTCYFTKTAPGKCGTREIPYLHDRSFVAAEPRSCLGLRCCRR